MFKNMSLLNTKLPGLPPSVVCMQDLMVCMAVDRASSINSFAWPVVDRGFTCNKVRSTLPTVWCILLQMAFACGFLLEVGTSFICVFSSRRWNLYPVNSPPLSCTYLCGHGYLDNQFLRISCLCALMFYRQYALILLGLSPCLFALGP